MLLNPLFIPYISYNSIFWLLGIYFIFFTHLISKNCSNFFFFFVFSVHFTPLIQLFWYFYNK